MRLIPSPPKLGRENCNSWNAPFRRPKQNCAGATFQPHKWNGVQGAGRGVWTGGSKGPLPHHHHHHHHPLTSGPAHLCASFRFQAGCHQKGRGGVCVSAADCQTAHFRGTGSRHAPLERARRVTPCRSARRRLSGLRMPAGPREPSRSSGGLARRRQMVRLGHTSHGRTCPPPPHPHASVRRGWMWTFGGMGDPKRGHKRRDSRPPHPVGHPTNAFTKPRRQKRRVH